MSKIYIIHENDEWAAYLIKRLKELNLPYEMCHTSQGVVNMHELPPRGVFYNRMSASSHTRGHRYAPELTAVVLGWLEHNNAKVINGSNALAFEISKMRQYSFLKKFGLDIPKTIAAVGKEHIVEAAKVLNKSKFIAKHNRGGKGLGVRLFHSVSELTNYVYSTDFEEPIDGITLLQEYIQSPEPFIYRCEFVGAKYLYTVKVSTQDGFELCPADGCNIGDAFCPVGEQAARFKIVENKHTKFRNNCENFLLNVGIDIGAIEFIKDINGKIYVYDVNTNTNYNKEAEEKANIFAMLEISKYLATFL